MATYIIHSAAISSIGMTTPAVTQATANPRMADTGMPGPVRWFSPYTYAYPRTANGGRTTSARKYAKSYGLSASGTT
jgi:hypothetical protein